MALSRKPQEIVEDSKNPLLAKHESWERVPVGDIADILNGFAFKSNNFTNDKGMPLIRIRDVGKDSSETYYDGEYDETYLVDDGDLLVGMDGDFRVAIWKGGKALLNQRVCKISLKTDEYNFKFLSYVLQPYLDAIHAETSAVTVKHLSSRSINEIPLPLPPKEHQKRIVAKIEELFSHIDASIAALKKAKQLLKQYRQSVLKAAVTGELTKEWREARNKDDAQGSANVAGGRTPGATKLEPASKLLERILKERRQKWEAQQLEQFKAKGKLPKDDKWKEKYKELALPCADDLPEIPVGWKWVELQHVFDVITDGDHQAPPKVDDGIPFLVIGDVNKGVVKFGDKRFVPRSYYEGLAEIRRPRKGDILYTVVGSFGIPVKVESDEEFCVQRHIAILKPSARMSVNYLYHILSSGFVFKQATDVSTGTAQKTVPLSGLRELKIPLPPYEEQVALENLIDNKLDAISRTDKESTNKILMAEKNKQSILATAFNGRLQ